MTITRADTEERSIDSLRNEIYGYETTSTSMSANDIFRRNDLRMLGNTTGVNAGPTVTSVDTSSAYLAEITDDIDNLQTDITCIENSMEELAKEQAKEIRALREELETLRNQVKLLIET